MKTQPDFEQERAMYMSGKQCLGIMLGMIALSFVILCIMASCDHTPARASEVQAIAEAIAAEAGGEGFKGMELVACTIANRARLWNKTPYQIVSQRSQYYGFTAKNRHKLYLQVKAQADYLAANIMSLQDKTGNALYFRQPSEPRYSWHNVLTLQYKKHIFYR